MWKIRRIVFVLIASVSIFLLIFGVIFRTKVILVTALKYRIKPHHLLAIAIQESSLRPNAIGDKGKSYGLFQIQIKLHDIKKEQALDPRFAAEWACQYLLKNNYRKDPERAIRKYNGSGPKAEAYARRVLKIAKTIDLRNF